MVSYFLKYLVTLIRVADGASRNLLGLHWLLASVELLLDQRHYLISKHQVIPPCLIATGQRTLVECFHPSLKG